MRRMSFEERVAAAEKAGTEAEVVTSKPCTETIVFLARKRHAEERELR